MRSPTCGYGTGFCVVLLNNEDAITNILRSSVVDDKQIPNLGEIKPTTTTKPESQNLGEIDIFIYFLLRIENGNIELFVVADSSLFWCLYLSIVGPLMLLHNVFCWGSVLSS